ncbi:hypothetical protein VTJ04DRAFT_6638 [Mycothermus thermophilus]|uniref:uncharacterized protein n=1 Tax=Humicola insolens TaxID=85995 RepID=UPI003742BD78
MAELRALRKFGITLAEDILGRCSRPPRDRVPMMTRPELSSVVVGKPGGWDSRRTTGSGDPSSAAPGVNMKNSSRQRSTSAPGPFAASIGRTSPPAPSPPVAPRMGGSSLNRAALKRKRDGHDTSAHGGGGSGDGKADGHGRKYREDGKSDASGEED